MDSILKQLANKEAFDAFIQDNMALSTYTPLWKQEIPDSEVEYSATGNFSTYTAEYEAAAIASVIAKNADKPLKNMPTLGQLTGSIARMGDRFQLDNDRLRDLMIMEDRFRNTSANFTETKRLSEWGKITDFLFKPYQSAAIAPHKRLDLLYFEGLSNGTLTVDLNNNPQGIAFDPIDFGVKKFGASGPVWSTATAGTMTALQDIRRIVDILETQYGKIVTQLRMSPATFSKMQLSNQFNQSVKLNLSSMEVGPAGMLSLEMANKYLGGLDLPPIKLERKMIRINDTQTINAFKDDRVVFQCAPNVAKMVISDPLELRMPHPNKQYSDYFDNLISQYRKEEGQFIEYEMWGLPVFSGKEDFAIMEVDRTEA